MENKQIQVELTCLCLKKLYQQKDRVCALRRFENWYFMDPYPQIKELYATNNGPSSPKNLKLTTLYHYFFNKELVVQPNHRM